MRTLELIKPGAHTAEDLEELWKADDAQPAIERIPLWDMDKKLRLGEALLFRVHPGPGVLYAEVFSDNGHKRLQIQRGAGRLSVSMHKILSNLWAYAHELGCECVTTVVYSERFMRALALSGASVEGWILTYSERGNGQQEEIHDKAVEPFGAKAS